MVGVAVQGVVAIILTWFIAPVLTGLVAAVIFLLVRTCVLRRKFAYTISFWLFPLLVFITVFINIFFVFTKVQSSRNARELAVPCKS